MNIFTSISREANKAARNLDAGAALTVLEVSLDILSDSGREGWALTLVDLALNLQAAVAQGCSQDAMAAAAELRTYLLAVERAARIASATCDKLAA